MELRRPTRHVISDATYLELVRSLLGTLGPSIVMAALFIATAWTCAQHCPGAIMTDIAAIGSMFAVLRVLVLIALRRTVAKRGLDMDLARSVERNFAILYLGFAICMGVFVAEAMLLTPVGDKTAIIALLVGYGAGVAAGVSLRPWIAIPAMAIANLPVVAVSVPAADGHYLLPVILVVLTVAGIASIINRYRKAVEMIEMRLRFASLAGRDPLTGLANRMALEDHFRTAVEVAGGKDVVLHCFDLDRFKPVNDCHGHLVGDLLLQAVALRLNRLLRDGDLAIRLGGDEFAVLQAGVEHGDEAELLARRIARSLAEPYSLDGREIRIGASVGSASGRDHGPDLARLLSVADHALYEMKKAAPAGRALAS